MTKQFVCNLVKETEKYTFEMFCHIFTFSPTSPASPTSHQCLNASESILRVQMIRTRPQRANILREQIIFTFECAKRRRKRKWQTSEG